MTKIREWRKECVYFKRKRNEAYCEALNVEDCYWKGEIDCPFFKKGEIDGKAEIKKDN